jgi:Zn-dependent peptidase ImmA (M78 family)
MTIFHEIGHAVLPHSGTRFRMNRGDYRSANNPTVAVQESQAKRFAAALAAPLSLLGDAQGADDIEQRFNLSTEAAQIRWEQLQAHRRKATGERRPLPPDVVDFLKEMRRLGNPIRSLE